MKNLLYAIVALLLLGCSSGKTPDEKPARPDGLTQVRLALNWFPEAEHGGFYAALVHGYYQKRGLQVEILGGGPDAPVIQRVATRAVEFGITNADDVLNVRAQEGHQFKRDDEAVIVGRDEQANVYLISPTDLENSNVSIH